ncbi:MAG: hypothetical protein JW822_00460 [Spirochaetales bacterium]|nr:hypothetical protein [Spirochaetales bacterium]
MMKSTCIINRYTYLLLCVMLLFAFLCCSCVVQEHITINPNGSGSLELVIDLDPALIQYIVDIGEASGEFESADDAVIFDKTEIRKELLSRPGIAVNKLQVSSIGRLELGISFQNIKQIFAADKVLAQTEIVKFVQGNTKILSFHLDKHNFSQILTLFPLFQTKEFKTLLPQEGESKEDYFDMLDFALDDGAALLKNTTVKFTVTVNGRIIKQSGGVKQNNTVYYSLALERILFLSSPTDYSIHFQ